MAKPMKPLVHFLIRGTRNQSVGLLTIGLVMFACSNLAEQAVSGRTLREIVQLLIILGGITITGLVFRSGSADTHRH